ncbi:MAG: VWA domain-containing protein [Candidatus Omnitrophica bacterium]|nr:VWA domain-containing protein [Candidatus Omnitrophota bacterium]
MRWAAFGYVNLIWLILGLVLFYLWANQRRKKALEKFADKQLISILTKTFNPKLLYVKQIILVSSLVFLVVALMRPQWGFRWQEVKRKGLDIMVAVDVSKSMLAEDIKPSRLERTKLALEDFVKQLSGDRIGLIAFSGTAFVQCPLTVDYNGFLLSVRDLNVNTIPRGGTSLASAIYRAIESFQSGVKKYKVLILITDGEAHEGDTMKAAELAKKEGIKIFCIGIGTPEGELIPLVDEKGNQVFLKDRTGAVVKTRLDEETLQKIALLTGGSYVRAQSKEFGLDLLYSQRIFQLEKRQLETKMAKQYEERFQIPLLCAWILLALEWLVTSRRKV